MQQDKFELVRTDKQGSKTVSTTKNWLVAVSTIKSISQQNKCLEKTETTCDVLENDEMVTYTIQ